MILVLCHNWRLKFEVSCKNAKHLTTTWKIKLPWQKKKTHKKPVYFNYKTLRTMPLLKRLQYISGLILHSQCHTRKSWGWNFPRSCEGGRSFCAQTFAKEDPWLMNTYSKAQYSPTSVNVDDGANLAFRARQRNTSCVRRRLLGSRHRWQRRLLKLRKKKEYKLWA